MTHYCSDRLVISSLELLFILCSTYSAVQCSTWLIYLGHRHLLHGVHHVRCLFAPVAFDYVALY